MVQEDEVLEALFFAQEQLKPILDLIIQDGARRSASPSGRPRSPGLRRPAPERSRLWPRTRILAAVTTPEKKARYQAVDQAKEEVLADLGEEVDGREKVANGLFSET